MIKKHKQVIFKKTHRYVNGDEDTNNMCREILVEPLSDFFITDEMVEMILYIKFGE